MNIVFFTIPPVVPVTGGAERSVVTVANWLETRGHRCFLLSVFPLKKETDDPRCVALPNGGGARSRMNRKFFEEFLAREKIGAVLWWPGGSRRFPFVELCRSRGVLAISCNRGQPDYYRRAALSKARGFDSLEVRGVFRRIFLALKLAWKDRKYRKIFAFNTRFSDAYQLLSEHYFPDFRAYFPGGNVPCPLVGIGNMCAFPREEPDFSQKKKELLFVGRLKFADKRPDYLLRIWARLETRFPEWSLRFVGSGADEPRLKKLAEKLGLERVRFEGFRKPQPYYREASIFCMTSAYEGFPNVLVEAASFGCVPVAFESFAAALDIISDGENGYLVPAFDLDAYAETLARLMSDDALRERLAKNALAQIPEKFSPEKIGAQWEALLQGKNRAMNELPIKNAAADGFRICWLDTGTDWLGVFSELRAGVEAWTTDSARLLQTSAADGKFVRKTWKVRLDAKWGGGIVIFKTEKIFRPWSLERVLRARKMRATALLARIERAHAAGFDFPMRIFLAAERYAAGMLRERFLICEFIDGKTAGRGAERDRAVVAAVRRAHAFGLCWGGDPNPCSGNILEDACGNLRGVDISPLRATWRERGKDLDFFASAGMLSGPLPFSVRIARLQAAFKNLFRSK